jgi:Fe-S cluster assembly ATP-binding protein
MSLLSIKNLHAEVEDKKILSGLDLTIGLGEIHVIMGPNGAGKSTLANVLMGHPNYDVTEGQVTFDGENLLEMSVDERAKSGLFMSFQHPQEVPGVTLSNFIRTAKREITGQPVQMLTYGASLKQKLNRLNMREDYLDRSLNQGFSGGEKKKSEVLQMAMLEPKLAVLDETDSGLDIDAIRIVYEEIQHLSKADNSIIIITHYNKILDYIKPDAIHVLVDGKIVASGDRSLADRIERDGYDIFK